MEHRNDSSYMGFQLKSVNNVIRRAIEYRFDRENMRDICGLQGPCIGYIIDNSKSSDVFQKDVEKAFNIRRSSATVMLQGLENKGYIKRVPVEYDARLKKIVATDKAYESHEKVVALIDSFHKDMEKGITPAEKAEFTRILSKITHNLEDIEKENKSFR
ncbi:MAG: MarR family transcriptional regulator [Acetatifactor sp.]|nr:MarR family transcriptional regulator [Acetatifactor sp.]